MPAAAVRLGGPALFIIIGREGCVGGLIDLMLKTKWKNWYADNIYELRVRKRVCEFLKIELIFV